MSTPATTRGIAQILRKVSTTTFILLVVIRRGHTHFPLLKCPIECTQGGYVCVYCSLWKPFVLLQSLTFICFCHLLSTPPLPGPYYHLAGESVHLVRLLFSRVCREINPIKWNANTVVAAACRRSQTVGRDRAEHTLVIKSLNCVCNLRSYMRYSIMHRNLDSTIATFGCYGHKFIEEEIPVPLLQYFNCKN